MVQHRSVTHHRNGAFVAAILALALVAIGGWVGWRTHYYPALNDFWPLLFQSNTFDWSNPESFKNGFFPPGYGTFLWLLRGEDVLARAFLTNVLFGAASLLTTYAMARRLGSPAGVAAAALTAFHPLVFSLTVTTGPDAGCILFLSAGFYLLIVASQSDHPRLANASLWVAGALFGVATLWRYHALIFSVTALLAVLVSFRPRGFWQAAVGPAAALTVLAFLSLLPGFSDQLAKAQAFGAYEALHSVNWYHMPTDFPPSIGELIRAEPEAFWRAYWQFNRPLLWVFVPPILATIFLRGSQRSVGVAILVLQSLYLPVVGIGTSLRGLAPVIPLAMLCVGLLIDRVRASIPSRVPQRLAAPVLILVALATVARPWWASNRAFIEGSVASYEWRRAVERELRSQGVTSPLQVFGDAGFHFVTSSGSSWSSYLPRSNGGWPRLDLYKLDQLAPEMSTESLDQFIDDCERSGITHVMLSGSSSLLIRELGQIYSSQRTHPRLRATANVAGLRIFRLTS